MTKEIVPKIEANVGEDAVASLELPPLSDAFQKMVAKKVKTVSASIKKLGQDFGYDVDVIVQVKIK